MCLLLYCYRSLVISFWLPSMGCYLVLRPKWSQVGRSNVGFTGTSTFCLCYTAMFRFYVPINVKPHYTPPGVHKDKVRIWQYKVKSKPTWAHLVVIFPSSLFMLYMRFELNFCSCQDLGQFVGIKSPCIAPIYPWWNIYSPGSVYRGLTLIGELYTCVTRMKGGSNWVCLCSVD